VNQALRNIAMQKYKLDFEGVKLGSSGAEFIARSGCAKDLVPISEAMV
jgi:hypothetical protein